MRQAGQRENKHQLFKTNRLSNPAVHQARPLMVQLAQVTVWGDPEQITACLSHQSLLTENTAEEQTLTGMFHVQTHLTALDISKIKEAGMWNSFRTTSRMYILNHVAISESFMNVFLRYRVNRKPADQINSKQEVGHFLTNDYAGNRKDIFWLFS